MSIIDAGGLALTAVLTALIVSLRFVMYGAVLAPRFRDQPGWFRWLTPWTIVDQTFAIATSLDDRGPALLVGRLRDRPAYVAALVGGLVTALALEVPYGLSLPAGAVAGATAAAVARRRTS